MNWLSFEGRINRLTYFLQNLLMSSVSFVLLFILALIAELDGTLSETAEVIIGLLTMFVIVIAALYGLSLGARRLHDLDKSAWWLLLTLLPFVNFFLGIVLLFVRGTNGPNRFGPDPLAPMSAQPAQ